MFIDRTYIQFFVADTEKVSIKWKTFYVGIFTLIAIDAFCSALAFDFMFDSFSYSCVFYVNPVFQLKDVVHIDPNINTTGSDRGGLVFNEYDDEIVDEEHIPGMNFKIPNVPDVEVRDGRFWIRNKTLSATVHVDLRQTVFTNVLTCDWILFAPLCTFVFAVFIAVLIVLYEKGGRGYATDDLANPWVFVFPCLLVSLVMVGLYILITVKFLNGMRVFCSNFQQYTGQQECTYLMNYFTIQKRFGRRYFYLTYAICHYSFPIGLVLWILQVLLSVARMICAPDFERVAIRVTDESIVDLDEISHEKVHKAVIETFPVLADALVVDVVDDGARRSRRRAMRSEYNMLIEKQKEILANQPLLMTEEESTTQL